MRRVALVCCSESTREQVSKFYGTDCKIWGLNQLYLGYPEIVNHATGWFQIHSDQRLLDYDTEHINWLRAQKFPIYMRKKFDDIPLSVPYPKGEIVERFGDYFTNSLSWMIALAIHKEYEEIHIFGADMAMDEEYMVQRPSAEYFVGLARGMGIRVVIPTGCDLLKTNRLYGFENSGELVQKMKNDIKDKEAKMLKIRKAALKARDERNRLQGALGSQIDSDEKREYAKREIERLTQKEENCRDQLNQYEGMCSALKYISRCWGHI